jgi:hypothetical protein
MSSLNPISMIALEGMRERLNRTGFSKVATGQSIHSLWMSWEMRRIRAAEPEAVFVVVGFESAGPVAVRLAERSAAEGLPIGAVVLLDSEGTTSAPGFGIRTLAVGNVQGLPASGAVDSVVLPDVSTFGLATDDRAIKAIGNVLADLASSVPVPYVIERSEWSYPHAPPMRPAGDPSRHPEWSMLFDDAARTVRYEKSTTTIESPERPNPPVVATIESAVR